MIAERRVQLKELEPYCQATTRVVREEAPESLGGRLTGDHKRITMACLVNGEWHGGVVEKEAVAEVVSHSSVAGHTNR